MAEVGLDAKVRAAMFRHLDELCRASADGSVSSSDVNDFEVEGRPLRLIVQSGIWKPASLEAALTIRTTYTSPGSPPPYVDEIGADGLVRYKYRGTDPQHSDNRALRTAMERGSPLTYFVGVASGVYQPIYPVFMVAEDRERHEFVLGFEDDQSPRVFEDSPERRYQQRLTNERLHQPLFRTRVLRAYGDRCALCRLRHPELLDAADIIPDGAPLGDAVVPNGLAFCKLHHAAYDQNVIGVTPGYLVVVRPDVMHEEDGPMLQYGIQAMNGLSILIPREADAQPDRQRLEIRYREFSRGR